MTRNMEEALEGIIQGRMLPGLTSGGRNTVSEGMEQIKALVEQAKGRVQIMAGSGVNAANANTLITLGVDAIHLSGKSSRTVKWNSVTRTCSWAGFRDYRNTSNITVMLRK